MEFLRIARKLWDLFPSAKGLRCVCFCLDRSLTLKNWNIDASSYHSSKTFHWDFDSFIALFLFSEGQRMCNIPRFFPLFFKVNPASWKDDCWKNAYSASFKNIELINFMISSCLVPLCTGPILCVHFSSRPIYTNVTQVLGIVIVICFEYFQDFKKWKITDNIKKEDSWSINPKFFICRLKSLLLWTIIKTEKEILEVFMKLGWSFFLFQDKTWESL